MPTISHDVGERGQPGQWREEWALVVRWSKALREIGRGFIDGGMCRIAQGEQLAYGRALGSIGEAMGWPEWINRRRDWR